MSTITREFTKEQLQQIIETDHVQCGEASALARIALASLEAEAVCVIDQSNLDYLKSGSDADVWPASRTEMGDVLLYRAAPPAPVSVPESAPVAYIFKHPAGRLFWSLTDESNKGQSDVMPVYSTPVPAFVPPAIEPDYEVIKGILPTANPDEYACCIAADMWNACRAAMLQGANGNSPVISDCVACSERMPGEVLAALQNVARLRRNLNDFCGEKSVIAKCLIEAEEALINAVNRHSTMLSEPQQEAKNV